jgi:hypothetical protein
LCEKYLPDFPISSVGFTTTYARQFFKVPGVSFDILQNALMGPLGWAFIRKAKRLNRPIYAWTVNDEKMMKWGIKKDLEGIVTDDPEKFLAICKDWKESDSVPSFNWKEWYGMIRLQLLISVYYWLFRWRVGSGIDSNFLRRRLAQAKAEK